MSKTLDQERILDSLKRQPRFTPSAVQDLPATLLPDVPSAVAVMADPVPEPVIVPPAAPETALPTLALAPQVIEASPVRRRYVLRAGLPILLLELALIYTVHPPMALPDLSGVPARLSAWLQRPAEPLPQLPQPTPHIIPAAVQTPVLAFPSEPPVPAAPALKRAPPSETLPSASAVPAPRTLAADIFAPRSTPLEDTRKVLRLMELALQNAAYAVVAAQDSAARRR